MANPCEADSGAPLLETERLRLRGHRLDDYAALSAMWGDPEVVRFIGGVPATPHDAWLRLLRYAGLWKLLGYGFWAIEEKATGRMIGDIGYMDVKRGLTPTLDGMPEVGWALVSDAHGRGYASEALAAVLAWGDAHFGAHRAACIIDSANAPSIRLATKMGFRFAHEATHRDDVVGVFVRDAG
jgi:RimJ/RimL family protein N-acetyltransferase